ncbi:molybdenum cofactor guanylyltransferase MobA [Malikia sp.]|uniref:molybdenum cofactor guanylyltransferase MobA n=1 Tax=Malikia sp. TaxID=2070706 RepID=UPI00261F5E57|nr:molybdenum cofactor guanylyltransferase MobA [Malikia sp.]MDD2729791.1 molybdenum cofactor guanylyltransferase MobA [Malikia sp.]
MNIGQVDALLLAGGQGSRMGGVDKGLQQLGGRPLAAHALERLRRQQGDRLAGCMVNANRNLDRYQALGWPVWPDARPDFPGPLAGFLAGLEQASSPWLLTVPCDSPLFPLDLLERLAQAAEREGADLALALGRDEQGRLRRQPVFCLLRRELADSLRAYLRAGGRKIDDWIQSQHHVAVAFDAPGDDPRAFFNANTLAELHALEIGL